MRPSLVPELYVSDIDKANDTNINVRQFLVQDPDGYLLRFAQKINY